MPVTMTFFLETALKSTALLGAAWVAVLLLRGKSAAVRHQVWSVALAAVLALPFFSTMLPALRVPVANSLLANRLLFRTGTHAAAQRPIAPREPQAITSAQSVSKRWLANSGIILTALWALGAAVSFAQMLIGWATVERMRSKAKPIAVPGSASLNRLLAIKGGVDLRESAAGSMPITYGLFRQTILLPADAMEWSAERRQVVLLHELAHVRRRDGATHLLARLALAIYWWHPLVWTAWRESLRERERAADDMVLNAGAGAADYASHLLAIATSLQSPAALGWAALAMARSSQLEGRLSAILDSRRDRNVPRRASAIVASLAAMAILLPLAALEAKSDTGQAAATSQATASSDAAAALINQGKAALSMKNYEVATSDFKGAQSADPKKTSEASMWMAITQQHQNNLDAADALYQIALNAEDPNSGAAATIMELYAAMLRDQNKQEAAAKMSDQAAAIRKAQAELAMSLSRPSSPGVHRIGGEVKAPLLESKVEPEYSEDARLAKYSGSVLLSIEINADGLPQDIRVIRPLGFGLDQKAVEAVTKWKFKPGILGGQPVAVMAQVEVNFRLL